MNDTEQLLSTLLAAVVALAAVSTVALTAGGVATAEALTPHTDSGNYTVVLPDDVDHYPGDQNRANASIHHLAALEGVYDGKGLEKASFLTIGNPEVDFSACTTSDTTAFGIDRGNDDAGTTTDEGLLRHRESSQFNTHGIVVDFYEGDEIGGEAVSINVEDEIVAVQQTCYTMPSEPGWYQIQGTLNGTAYDGSFQTFHLSSHYFYICACDSEQEAREKLGPPPSESSASGGGDPTPTATATPQATATPSSQGTPTAAPEETATPRSQSTATAAPQATATPSSQGTATAASQATATPQRQGGGNAGTVTETTASQQSGGDQSGGDQQAPRDDAPSQQDDVVTPTAGSGQGFGLVTALGALVALGLLARRR